MPVWDLLNKNKYLKDQNVYNERVRICNNCPEQKFNVIARARQCNKCKCFTDAKAKIEREQCPLGKW